MAKGKPDDNVTRDARESIGMVVVVGATIFITISAIMVVLKAPVDDKGEAAQMIFNSALPMVGTWVGTVLAFYFTRENFAAANKSMQGIVEATMEERLRSLSVATEMIPLAKMSKLEVPAGGNASSITIASIRKLIVNKVSRVPILQADGVALHVIHESILDRFVSKKVLNPTPGTAFDPATATLGELLLIAELKTIVTDLIAYVPEDASVADAKRALEAKPGCQDVFVTKTGASSEPVAGWLTDKRIARASDAKKKGR